MQKTIDLMLSVGRAKAAKPAGLLLAQAVMAGAFVSLGGLLSVFLGYGMPAITAANPGIQRLLSGLAFQRLLSGAVFPLGLILVVFTGAELFTGNNAVLMPALMRRSYGLGAVARNWTLVWLGNLVGALAFVLVFVLGAGLTDIAPYHDAVAGIASAKTSLPPAQILLRGIAANWCVCLAVWLAVPAQTLGQKALACWIPVGAFVVLGYEHSIANMFFIPCGMLAGAEVSAAAAISNILWATVGNILGGALLVGLVFHGLYGRQK